MRVLMTTIPAYGHFAPLVPLGEALLESGHEVAVATAAPFDEVVSSAGFEHIPAGIDAAEASARTLERHPDYPRISNEERTRRIVPEHFVGVYAPALLADTGRLTEWRPDVVIREEGEFAAPVVAALMGVPCAEHGWGPMRPPEQVDAAAEALAPIWEAAGLEAPPLGGAYEWLYLDPCPRALQLPQAENVSVRHLIRPASLRPSPDGAPDWLKEPGQPVIYITLGTVATFAGDTEFLLAAITAMRDEDVEIVVTVGPRGDPTALGLQPANVHVEKFLPQAEVLAHCAVAVTNGGSGSTLGALTAGVPLLIVPNFSPSQIRNAHAVAAAGAGRTLERRDVSVERLRTELLALLGDGPHRTAAQGIAAEIAQMPSPAEAVRLVEELVETHAPLSRS